ncbi:MAG: NADH:flavin oxidoreductase [Desulfobacterales bacterium]
MAALKDEMIINGMRLRNRIALPPLTTNYGTPEGVVTEDILDFYADRSKDVGLVIVEATAVRPDGRLVRGSLGLWEDGQTAGMKQLADSIKTAGAAAVVQLNHAGARCVPSGGELQGASPSGFPFRPDVAPLIMNQAQIDQLAADFAHAAVRAAEAGFDGVEIHGAHYYLISQFLSPLTNQRNDRYGGGARERSAFALDVVRAVRQRLGQSYPIFFRLNAVEKVAGGQTLEDALTVSKLLADEGVDVLDVSVIANSSWNEIDGRRFLAASSALSKEQPAGANVSAAAAVREAAGLPVIAVGKLGEEDEAAEALRDFSIDIVAIGRQMIVDPAATEKILAGKSDEIIRCEECMTCFASIRSEKPMACKVNRKLPGSRRSG